MSEHINCPECNAELAMRLVMKPSPGETVQYQITPKPGSFFSARSVGMQMRAVGRLLEVMAAHESGLKVIAMLSGMSMNDQGAITFDLVMAETDPA